MKLSVKGIIGYTIKGVDEVKGKVKDFLFDEETWIVRYLDGDFGLIFFQNRILIPRILLKESDWINKDLLIGLDKSEIEKCPPLEDKLPVSRLYEESLLKHYKTKDYWSRSYFPPIGAPAITHAGNPWNGPSKIKVPAKTLNEKDLDTSLRSFTEIMGYQIEALDGTIGQIDDIVIDEKDWRICYVIVQTGNWFLSNKVLIGTLWMEEISYVNRSIKVGLTVESVKSAPVFDSYQAINIEYEEELSTYYSRSKTVRE
jgi:sporulation protein YlmC with PRC-barrel domain